MKHKKTVFLAGATRLVDSCLFIILHGKNVKSFLLQK